MTIAKRTTKQAPLPASRRYRTAVPPLKAKFPMYYGRNYMGDVLAANIGAALRMARKRLGETATVGSGYHPIFGAGFTGAK